MLKNGHMKLVEVAMLYNQYNECVALFKRVDDGGTFVIGTNCKFTINDDVNKVTWSYGTYEPSITQVHEKLGVTRERAKVLLNV
jgi:hypothetical protein